MIYLFYCLSTLMTNLNKKCHPAMNKVIYLITNPFGVFKITKVLQQNIVFLMSDQMEFRKHLIICLCACMYKLSQILLVLYWDKQILPVFISLVLKISSFDFIIVQQYCPCIHWIKQSGTLMKQLGKFICNLPAVSLLLYVV